MQNRRTETLLETYKPSVGIIVYQSKTKDFYLESHSFDESGKMLEGKPLLQETIQGMVDVFFDERQNSARIKGLIPENMISFELLPGGKYKMIWFRPAEIRVIHFAPQLKLNTGKVWVPAMLYATDGKSLNVYSLKANTRPKEATKIHLAPFHNVSDDGLVCLGSAHVTKPKSPTYESLIQYWEDLFWLSEFTHVNDSEKVRSENLHAIWKKLLASKTKLKWSDINELLPYEKATLKSLLK